MPGVSGTTAGTALRWSLGSRAPHRHPSSVSIVEPTNRPKQPSLQGHPWGPGHLHLQWPLIHILHAHTETLMHTFTHRHTLIHTHLHTIHTYTHTFIHHTYVQTPTRYAHHMHTKTTCTHSMRSISTMISCCHLEVQPVEEADKE